MRIVLALTATLLVSTARAEVTIGSFTFDDSAFADGIGEGAVSKVELRLQNSGSQPSAPASSPSAEPSLGVRRVVSCLG